MKRKYRVMVAGGMALALLLSGCGKKTEENAAVSKKPYVYVPEFHDIDAEYLSQNHVLADGNLVYYIKSDYVQEEGQTEGKNITQLCTIKTETNETESMKLQMDENSSVLSMAKAPDGTLKMLLISYVYGTVGEEADQEAAGDAAGGTEEAGVEPVEDTTEEPVKEEAAEAEAEQKDPEQEDTEPEDTEPAGTDDEATAVIKETGSGSSAMGYGYMMTSTSVIGGNDDGMPTDTRYGIYTMNADGTLVQDIDLTEQFNDDQMGVSSMVIDKEGLYYLGTGKGVCVVSPDGGKVSVIETDNWVEQIFQASDGTVMALYYGNSGMEAHPIDGKAGTFGEADTKLMSAQYGNFRFGTGGEGDVFFSQDNIVYTYNFGDEKPTELFTWLECDLDYNRIAAFAGLDDGRIFVVVTGMGENAKSEAIYLTKKKSSEVPEKKTLTLGTIYLSDSIRRMTIDFNKKNPEYRIEVISYGNYDMDHEVAVQNLNTAVASGNCPDIINISGISFKNYAVKGTFEDLEPYFAKDQEIKKEDYLQNAMDIYRVQDKLYAIFPGFIINTVMGSTDVLGDRTKITIDEMISFAKELPEGKKLFAYATKDYILTRALAMDMERYVNWETGECKLNSEDFLSTLEFAAMFDTEIKDYDVSEEEGLRDGTVLFSDRSISSVQDYQAYDAILDGKANFVGYPTGSEQGSYLSTYDDILAISSKSNYKDAAWQFLKGYLTEDFQMNNDRNFWGFPVMKKALDAKFKEDMVQEYTQDEEGNKIKQTKTEWMFGSFSIQIFAANQKQVDTMNNLINSVSATDQTDLQILNIIKEEAAPFFEGQKSAKAAADIIQSRVQIYVNENR